MLSIFLLGIVNSILIPFFVYLLWRQNAYFSFLEKPLSYTRKTHTKLQFITFFVIGTALEGGFIFLLFNQFSSLQSFWLTSLTIAGLAASFLIGLTTHTSVRALHKATALFFIILMISWSFIFHTLLLSVSVLHGIAGLLLSAITSIGMAYYYFKVKSVGYSEVYFVLMLTLWNILMSSLYFVTI